MMNAEQLAAIIDHTLLKPEATGDMIDRLCAEATEYGFHAVCVNPVWVRRCVSRLGGSGVQVAAVVGFPLGAHRADTKVDEARRAVEDGARELDMMIALGQLVAGEDAYVRDEIAAVVQAARQITPASMVKAILETAALTDEQIERGCRLAVDAGANMLKTSTGFHPAGGARVEHVRLLKAYARDRGVKAAGGIRTPEDAFVMVQAGATRIGTSAGPAIIKAVRSPGPRS